MKTAPLIMCLVLLGGCAKHGAERQMPPAIDTSDAAESATAERATPDTSSVFAAYQMLREATVLDNLVNGKRGPAGENIWAFNVLLRATDAQKLFARLFAGGGHYAQCYSLIGLKLVDSDRYAGFRDGFVKKEGQQRYGFGCMGLEIENAEFVQLLESGRMKSEYFVIGDFEAYLNDRDSFIRDADEFMVETCFGL